VAKGAAYQLTNHGDTHDHIRIDRPDIEQHDLAFEVGKTARVSLAIVESDRRDHLWLVKRDEILRRLLRYGGPGDHPRGHGPKRRAACQTSNR
jgi:hypothetical protein